MSLTDKLPESAIPAIKYGRDEFHRKTSVRRFGSGVSLQPLEDSKRLLLVKSEIKDRSGSVLERLELPGGGIGIIDGMRQRMLTNPRDSFTPVDVKAFFTNAKNELKQETGIDIKAVQLRQDYEVSEDTAAGPDFYMVFHGYAPLDAIANCISRGVASNEVKSIDLYTEQEASEYFQHHAVAKGFTNLAMHGQLA